MQVSIECLLNVVPKLASKSERWGREEKNRWKGNEKKGKRKRERRMDGWVGG